MAKQEEEELKKVDLMISINCCDGCRRKVLKALSIKGVLKTEIHPTLPKITVTGNVDTSTLIKKLAKIGKSAELMLPLEETEQNQENEVAEENSERIEKISKEGVKERNADHDGKTNGKSKQQTTISVSINAQDIGNEATTFQEERKNSYDHRTVVSAIPQVNYLVNPDTMPPYFVQGYYSMMSTNHVPCYAMNVHATPQPYRAHNHEPSQSLMYRQQQMQSQAQQSMRFTDYFNDENTAGCNVM